MNIAMVNPDGGAFFYILKGYRYAFESLGHKVMHWDKDIKKLDEFKPDLYIGSSGWQQEIPYYIRDKYNTKIIYHVNPFFEYKIGSVEGGPVIDEPMASIQWVVDQRPDALIGYFINDDITYWSNWTNIHGIPVYGVPTAGDHFNFYEVEPKQQFKCDIAFVGGSWPYKSININRYFEPVRKKFNSKVYGWGGWGAKSGGEITDENVRVLFSSAKIGPCIHEPHTSIYGIDIPERVFKLPLCGLPAICDLSPSIYKYFSKEDMPMAEDPSQYLDFVEYYLKNDDKRDQLVKRQRKHVLSNHTYFNRIKTIFASINEFKEIKKVQDAINILKEKHV